MKTLNLLLFVTVASLAALVGCSDKDKGSNHNPYGWYVRQGQYCVDSRTGQQVPFNYCQYGQHPGMNGTWVYDTHSGQCVDYQTRMPAPHPSYCQNGGYPGQPGYPNIPGQPGYPGTGYGQSCYGTYYDPYYNNSPVQCNSGNPYDQCRGRQLYNSYGQLVYCQ